MATLTISHTTRSYPTLPYEAVASRILGKHYELSLTFLGEQRAAALNAHTRKRAYVPNVLSFPLSKWAGEVYLCPAKASREARRFGRTPETQVLFLFIHGVLHLKGYDHGEKMERQERLLCADFNCQSTLS